MRSAVSFLSSLVLATILLCAQPAISLGDQLSEAQQLRRDVLEEWRRISNGRTDFEISDLALVPNQLALAAKQSGCDYKEGIKTAPVHFIRIKDQRLAILFCFAIIGSHQVFDLSNLQEPSLVRFPFLAQPKGFGMPTRPGVISFEKETGVFMAVTGSDLLPSPSVRHTYRFAAPRGFVVVRVEFQQDGLSEWTTLWDAPDWSFPATTK